MLALDPAVVHGVLSNERIARRERVRAMGRRVGAVAGVNGGYFAPSGDPVGVLAIDGTLLSEPVDGRSALLVGAGTAAVAPVRFRGSVTINGVKRRSTGSTGPVGWSRLRRPRRRPAHQPAERRAHLLRRERARAALADLRRAPAPRGRGGGGLRDGIVARVRGPGTGPVPRDGLLLTGTGDAARFLRDAALPRSRAEVELALTAAGRRVDLAQQTLVVGGGPRLVRAGRVAVSARLEGFAPPQAPAFFGTFVAARQPRTLAGVRADGTVLLVTVDGRRPGWSVGMTLPEAARLMLSLGARDALNLDGGGSSDDDRSRRGSEPALRPRW